MEVHPAILLNGRMPRGGCGGCLVGTLKWILIAIIVLAVIGALVS